MKNRKIVLIGPYPPPYGGVSVHINRLVKILNNKYLSTEVIDESRIRKLDTFNLRSLSLLRYLKILYEADCVHIHSGTPFLRFFNLLCGKFLCKRTVLTLHSYKTEDKEFINKFLDRFVVTYSDKVIFVNTEMSKRFSRKDFFLKEAFIPDVTTASQELPSEMLDWLAVKRMEGYTVCCANASKLKLFDNQDLYGLDLCIDALITLKGRGEKYAVIFIVCDVAAEYDLGRYKQVVEEHLSDTLLIWEGSISFGKLIIESDIVLRPTNTDGDALSVREGLFYNRAVVASDVVKRPVGTILFKSRDANDLVRAMESALSHPVIGLPIVPDYNGFDELTAFYAQSIYGD